MTYVINITGSKQTSSDDESREFEQGIVDKAREFVASLEGVHSASVSGNQIGSVGLLQPKE